MGKINRFMPTKDYSLFEKFEDGEIFWSFDEDDVTKISCLTITFIRNVPNLENSYFKEIIYRRGLKQMDSKDYHLYSDKPGIFKEIEFWEPHYEKIAKYMEQAKIEFSELLILN